jgi:hypothetical protein
VLQRRALRRGPGSADLLLPRLPLGDLLLAPGPALARRGGRRGPASAVAPWRFDGRRSTAPGASGWLLDDEPFDAVMLACTCHRGGPAWHEPCALSLGAGSRCVHYEPIATVVLRVRRGSRRPCRRSLPWAPAQFAFDLTRRWAAARGHFSFVISGAADGLDAGREADS